MTIGNTSLALNTTLSMLWLATNMHTQVNYNAAVFNRPADIMHNSLAIEIMKRDHQREELKNIVLFISHYLLGKKDAAVDEFIEKIWNAFPIVPVVVVNNNTMEMRGFLSRPTMCLIITRQWNDPIMELAAVSLKGVRYLKTIFLLFPEEQLSEDFERIYQQISLIYEWSWKQQFLNTLLITTSDQVYLYDPFPTPSIINKTDDWHLTEFFTDKRLNVKGMEIRTPVRFDIPRVFCLRRDFKLDKRRAFKITGNAGKIFGTFLEKINATLNVTDMLKNEFEPFNVTGFVKMVEDKKIEMSVHAYTNLVNTTVGSSYPIGINDFCFMVPYRNSSAGNMFLAKIFYPETLLLLCFAALYVTFGIWLCLPAEERDLSLSFLEAICSLILIPPLRLILLSLARIRFLFVLLFLAGFCITNLYNAQMTSVLTAVGGEKQIDTVQDILNAKLVIMMLLHEVDILAERNFDREFLKTVLPVEKTILDKHREKLNTSYGYTVSSDRWGFINKQQDYLNTPIFRLTSICVGPYYYAFPLQKDSYLLKPLNDLILQVSQSGFMSYWKKEAFEDALFMGYVHMIKVYHDVQPLTIQFFTSLWGLWIGGLCLGLFAFVMEIKGQQQLAKFNRWLKSQLMN